MDELDPARLRISDQDRHRVAEVLREAAAEGRIDLDELDERLEAAYGAKTYGELVPITSDLPAHHQTGLPSLPGPTHPTGPVPYAGHLPVAATYDYSVAVMSGVDRKGVWRVGPTHHAFSFWGGVRLDLREAVFSARETVINANTIMGGVDIWVNAHTHVVVEGMGLMGAFEQGRDRVPPELTANSPVVRVRGMALMGGVTVTRKRMPGQPGPVRKMLGQ